MTDLTLAGILNEASSAYPSRARIEFNARAPKPSPACPKKCLRVTALSFCSRRGREGTIIIFRDWLSVANFRSKLTRRFWVFRVLWNCVFASCFNDAHFNSAAPELHGFISVSSRFSRTLAITTSLGSPSVRFADSSKSLLSESSSSRESYSITKRLISSSSASLIRTI